MRLPLGDVTKVVAQPGWKWSTHIKPLVGTELCTAAHFGVVIEGSVTVLQDGVETVCKAGDVFYMPAGHDAWVGDEGVVMYEFNQSNLLNMNK